MATDEEYQRAFEASCRSYWTTRGTQALTGGGEGLAAAVRAGKHFASLEDLVASVFVECGYGPDNFLRGGSATVPGYYRPTKTWDLVVRDGPVLVAALELKGLGAKSAGNNFNNRTEEAIGNAVDLRLTDERTGAFGSVGPWCGFVFLMEDAPATRSSRRPRPTPWAVDPGFGGASYLQRGELLSLRMQSERLYDAVCYVTSSADPHEAPREPCSALSWINFVAAIRARVEYVRNYRV